MVLGFCLFLFFYREGLEESNPSYLRQLGRHRLDGGETAICAIGADANESLSACQRRIIRTTFTGSDYFCFLENSMDKNISCIFHIGTAMLSAV